MPDMQDTIGVVSPRNTRGHNIRQKRMLAMLLSVLLVSITDVWDVVINDVFVRGLVFYAFHVG